MASMKQLKVAITTEYGEAQVMRRLGKYMIVYDSEQGGVSSDRVVLGPTQSYNGFAAKALVISTSGPVRLQGLLVNEGTQLDIIVSKSLVIDDPMSLFTITNEDLSAFVEVGVNYIFDENVTGTTP